MSQKITRDDLAIVTVANGPPFGPLFRMVTDEDVPAILRTLLIDECDCVGWGQGAFRDAEPHGPCGGRGWLPKPQVRFFNGTLEFDKFIGFSVDWLETEDEQ